MDNCAPAIAIHCPHTSCSAEQLQHATTLWTHFTQYSRLPNLGFWCLDMLSEKNADSKPVWEWVIVTYCDHVYCNTYPLSHRTQAMPITVTWAIRVIELKWRLSDCQEILHVPHSGAGTSDRIEHHGQNSWSRNCCLCFSHVLKLRPSHWMIIQLQNASSRLSYRSRLVGVLCTLCVCPRTSAYCLYISSLCLWPIMSDCFYHFFYTRFEDLSTLSAGGQPSNLCDLLCAS